MANPLDSVSTKELLEELALRFSGLEKKAERGELRQIAEHMAQGARKHRIVLGNEVAARLEETAAEIVQAAEK